MTSHNAIVLKLGGSLVVPKDIDVDYLRHFVALIKRHIERGKRFVIIVGGGYTNRWYRDRAQELGVEDATDLHWIGILATRLNAELVRTLFGVQAHARTYWDFEKPIDWQEPVLLVGGYEPGVSTDMDAVLVAKELNIKKVINISNVPFLYTADPKKDPDAEPIREISWKDYRALFGNPTEHLPGQNIPIDAVAALHSQEMNIETFYVGGHNLENLDHLLSGREWEGTRLY